MPIYEQDPKELLGEGIQMTVISIWKHLLCFLL